MTFRVWLKPNAKIDDLDEQGRPIYVQEGPEKGWKIVYPVYENEHIRLMVEQWLREKT